MAFKSNEHYPESINPSLLTVHDCSACSLPICDSMIFRVNENYFHSFCLNCSECHMKLFEKCYTQNGNIYCQEDFFKKFGSQCSACGYTIPSTDVVRRANEFVYHLQCFACCMCHGQLNTGDEFYLIDEQKLLCKTDHDALKNKEFDEANKRLRTTINQNQLDVLKQAYTISSKPARYVRESLALETGLDMRVVQVWFQNRRAKEKRLKKDVNKRWSKPTKQTKSRRSTLTKTRHILEEDETSNECDTAISFDESSEHDTNDSISPDQHLSFNGLLQFNPSHTHEYLRI